MAPLQSKLALQSGLSSNHSKAGRMADNGWVRRGANLGKITDNAVKLTDCIIIG